VTALFPESAIGPLELAYSLAADPDSREEAAGLAAEAARLATGADTGRISHAQMFTGLSGYGGLPLALAYAQYVNCTDRKDGDSCGVCPSCLKTAALAHPDLHFLFPVNSSSKGGSTKPGGDTFLPQWRDTVAATGGYFDEQMWYRAIDIENQQGIISRADADELVRKLSYKSFEARFKVVIIWLPEKMRTEAANSLLKILEEPWDGTLFLLVSQSPQFLLPTILSRVQQTEVPRIGAEDLERWLVYEKKVEPARAAEVVRLSGGDLLEAASIAADGGASGSEEYFELFKQLMRLSYGNKHMELIEWADSVAGMGREEQKRLLTYTARLLRSSYMLTAGMPALSYLWGEEKDFCTKFAPFIDNRNIEALIDEVTTASEQVARNGNPRMIFPHFALTVSKMIG
jgi:DNA polymerase-3 subunit delta'